MPDTTVDVDALYAALDHKRQDQRLSWRALASRLEIPASTFTRMAQGLKPDVDAFASMIRWLGMSPEDFLRPVRRRAQPTDPVAMISSYLRGLQNVSTDQAEALEDIISAAYRHLVKERK